MVQNEYDEDEDDEIEESNYGEEYEDDPFNEDPNYTDESEQSYKKAMAEQNKMLGLGGKVKNFGRTINKNFTEGRAEKKKAKIPVTCKPGEKKVCDRCYGCPCKCVRAKPFKNKTFRTKKMPFVRDQDFDASWLNDENK